MLGNYIKIAIRNLIKHKGYTIINVAGLAIGIACCILIFLFIRHEWSYDTFHEKADQIFRVVIQERAPDGTIGYRNLQPPDLAAAMVEEFPGVTQATRIVRGGVTIIHDNQPFRETLFEADSSLFRMFTFPLVAGDPMTALRDPASIVISEDIAQKYFSPLDEGYQRVLGKRLSIKRRDDINLFTISGVMENAPDNSSLPMEIIISFENYEIDKIRVGGNDWGSKNTMYIELADGQDPLELMGTLPTFTAAKFANRIEGRRNGDFIGDSPDDFQLYLQPLRDLHLNPTIGVGYEQAPHNPMYSYILSGIAVMVLCIACINFMTLAVGRSAGRAREVGMRKVFGAYRPQLMRQFWGEAILLSGCGLILGVLLAALFLPLFNQFTTQNFTLSDFMDGSTILVLLGLVLFVGLVAGSYPAVVLSRFQPISVLKGSVKAGGKNRLIRGMVVVQYTLSIALMIGTGLIAQQLDYIASNDLGYTKENVVIVQAGGAGSQQLIEQYRNELKDYDAIVNVASAGYSFTRGGDRRSWRNANGVPRWAWAFGVDYDYMDLMDMDLVTGRNFSRDLSTDPISSILVNETLVKEFGLAKPIGHKLVGWGDGFMAEPPTIIGVVEDFNFESLHVPVRPAIMTMHPDYRNSVGAILVKIRSRNIAETLTLIEKTWTNLAPNTPFNHSFLDQDIANQYQTEERWGRIIGYASGLSILIACLGLFGLATLAVANRTKEIGIRKVLGAPISQIVLLIAREFVGLVALAAVFAWPLAYFAIGEWLEAFEYRINIGPLMFLLSSVLAILVALVTLSYQAVRAALANPVKTLQYE